MKFSVNIATFIIYLGPCCSFSFWYGRLTVVWVWPFNMLLSLCMQPSLSTPSLLCWTHTSVIRWRQLWCICSVYRVLYSVCVHSTANGRRVEVFPGGMFDAHAFKTVC